MLQGEISNTGGGCNGACGSGAWGYNVSLRSVVAKFYGSYVPTFNLTWVFGVNVTVDITSVSLESVRTHQHGA